jgi:hypothetical protein
VGHGVGVVANDGVTNVTGELCTTLDTIRLEEEEDDNRVLVGGSELRETKLVVATVD